MAIFHWVRSTRHSDQLLIGIDCAFDASLVPGTCLGRLLDLKGLINKFLKSRVLVEVGCDLTASKPGPTFQISN